MYAVHNLLCFVEEKPLATFHNLFPVTELMRCDWKLCFVFLVNVQLGYDVILCFAPDNQALMQSSDEGSVLLVGDVWMGLIPRLVG